MRIVGYHIEHNLIASSDGEIAEGEQPLEYWLSFLLMPKDNAIRLFWNLDYALANLLRSCHIEEEGCRILHDKGKMHIIPENYGFSYIWPNFLIVLGFYLLITMTPLVAGSLWKRRAEIDSDVDVAMKYPRFIEALETLIARHHSLPYGITSYKTRLERIRSRLGDEGERRELGLGLQ